MHSLPDCPASGIMSAAIPSPISPTMSAPHSSEAILQCMMSKCPMYLISSCRQRLNARNMSSSIPLSVVRLVLASVHDALGVVDDLRQVLEHRVVAGTAADANEELLHTSHQHTHNLRCNCAGVLILDSC